MLGATVEEVEEQTEFKPAHGGKHVRFYPPAARYSDGLLAVDTRDGSVIELLEKN